MTEITQSVLALPLADWRSRAVGIHRSRATKGAVIVHKPSRSFLAGGVRSGKLVALPLLVLLATTACGCAFTADYIDLRYTPQPNIQAIEAARGIRVEVTVKDVRTQTDRVAAKGVANQAAPIISRQDVKTVVKDAIATELVQRGYTLAPGNVLIACDLSNFSATWQVGFWSGSAHGSCQLSVKIKDRNGDLVFAEIVSGEATKKGVQATTGPQAKVALERALQDAMQKLFEMPDFFRAIEKANART